MRPLRYYLFSIYQCIIMEAKALRYKTYVLSECSTLTTYLGSLNDIDQVHTGCRCEHEWIIDYRIG